MSPLMPSVVETATLLLRPRAVADLGNTSPLWHGNAAIFGGEVRLYLKRASAPEMLSECLCAVIGEAMGLPIPPIYLVHDPQKFIGGGAVVGSLDADRPSLRHALNLDEPTATAALAAWPQLPQAVAFDEWVANPDRNQGNLLWDAASGWSLIDHARALGAWPPGAPVPTTETHERNQLASVLVAASGDFGLMRARKQAGVLGARYRTLTQENVASAIQAQRFGMAKRGADALLFLASRLDHLPALLARHGRQSELPL